MSVEKSENLDAEYKKARELKVVVNYENDDSQDGKMRVRLAKEIICQLILLGQKRGRTSQQEDIVDEAA